MDYEALYSYEILEYVIEFENNKNKHKWQNVPVFNIKS
jgi:hypothetical protein